MYKDVKKKLLSVALCVCMVIGAVQVVPKAKAAANFSDGWYTVTVKNGSANETAYVKLDNNSFTYTGREQIPTVYRVALDKDDPSKDITSQFNNELTVPSGQKNVNVGTFIGLLQSNGTGGYTSIPDQDSNGMECTINKATINHITVTSTKQVLTYKGKGIAVTPQLETVTVELDNGSIPYQGSSITQYFTVSEFTGTGRNQKGTVKLNVSSSVAENFTNPEIESDIFSCDVGYDLSSAASLNTSKFQYTGNDLKSQVQLTILDLSDSTPVLSAASCSNAKNSLKFQFKKQETSDSGDTIYTNVSDVTDVGTYRVEVTPLNGANSIATLGTLSTQVYTGTFVGDFEVTAQEGKLLATAKTDDGATVDLDEANSSDYRRHIKMADTNGEVLPKDLKVYFNDKNHLLGDDQYTLSFKDASGKDARPNQAGTYEMTITPKKSTNYGGSRTFTYNVYSSLQISSLFFDGSAEDRPTSLEYNGEGYQVDTISVLNESNVTLRQGRDYTIEYQYKIGTDSWDTASNYNDSNMMTIGEKRILVKGAGAYVGQETSHTYTVVGVNMNNPDEESNFKLELVGGPTWNYEGKEIMPNFTFKYKTKPIDTTYYMYQYTNNIDAGKAKLTVTADPSVVDNPFTGSKTVEFKINQLNLSSAVFAGDGENTNTSLYSYTGNQIEPQLKIGNYTLKENVDYTVVYQDSTGTRLDEIPRNPGSYRLSITSVKGNDNVKGSSVISYQIIDRDIANDKVFSFQLRPSPIEWNGGETKPEVYVGGSLNLKEGENYKVEFQNNDRPTDVSGVSASAIITGINHLTGKKTISFEITKRNIDNADIRAICDVDNAKPPYKATLSLRDQTATKKALEKGVDYEIQSITYKTEKGYDSPNLDALERAGVYVVTIAGKGNYQGTREVEIVCGTDISKAELEAGTESLTYDGTEQYPTIYATVDKTTIKVGSGKVNEANAPFGLIFSRDSSQKVEKGYEGVYAGAVTVQAVGNTKNGYYGTTQKTTTYRIAPLKITDIYQIDFSADKKATRKGTDVYYRYTGEAITPYILVEKEATVAPVSASAVLRENVDFQITYGSADTRVDTGYHPFTVNGIGNFTGKIDSGFYVEALGIGSSIIKASYANDGGTYADNQPPTLILTYGGNPLKEDVNDGTGGDYTVRVTSIASPSSIGWNNYYKYTITGENNYANTSRTEYKEVIQTTIKRPAGNLDDSSLTDPVDHEIKDTWISAWDYDELMVNSDTQKWDKPEKFTLTYRKKDGSKYNLKIGQDFELGTYVSTKTAGSGSKLTITGINGFIGEETYDIPLFTDISKAKFAVSSTIKPDGSVSTAVLQNAMDNGTLSELVTLEKVRTEEAGAYIPTDCYNVELPNDYKKATIGELTLTISGKHDKYYAGNIEKIKINVTGELTKELTTVEIGDNNTIPWEGVQIMPGTTNSASTAKVLVMDGTTQLKGGYVDDVAKIPSDWDYRVTFTNNSGVGLATATITGVNTYSGTITCDFKITYQFSKLVVKLQKDGAWQEYQAGDSIEYMYQIDAEKNKPAVKLFYTTTGGALSEVTTNLFSCTYSGYQGAGNAMLVIGEPENADYKGILLGDSRVVNYILTPIPLSNVNIDISNKQPVYTGNEMNATDIGLKITYGSYVLTDADYTLIFKDAINTDDVDGKPARVIITAKGNFDGQIEQTFNIQPLPIASQTDINAIADTLIYTGEQQKPKLTVNQVTGRTRTLVEGTDYQIVKYLNDTKTALQDTPFSAIGTYYVRIEGLGNYASTLNPYRDIQYEIVTREVTDGLTISFVDSAACPVLNGVPTCVYNGNAHEPSIRVTYNDKILNGPDNSNPEYDLTYTNNTNAGKATVTITGVGSFAGTKTVDFTIQPKDITGTDIDYRDKDGNEFQNDVSYDWTKATVHPEINIYDRTRNQSLIVGDDTTTTADYSIGYDDDNGDFNTQANAGLVTMTITGQNNYTGTKEFVYYIGEDISKAYTLVNGSRSVTTTYNGLEQAPAENSITVEKGSSALTLVDENGENRYDIAYYKNGFDKANKVDRDQIIDAATYYIAVVGVPSKGTYAKTSEANSCAYTIYPRSIAPSYVLVSGYDGSYYYTGQSIEPKAITVEDTDLPVTGDQADPQRRSVKLVNGTDYDISYTNNTSAGKASIIVTGKGNYGGSRVAYFNIVSSNTDGNNTWDGTSEGTGSISNGSTSISANDIILGYDSTTYNCMMYNGYERIPTVSINGLSNSDFVITASNNIRPGVATLMITGINNYTGTIYKNYTIKADLSTYGTVSTIADQSYTGYQITPYVTVTCGGNLLTVGNDYTVTYANNTNVGRATVIATAAANSYYVGTANGYFNISNTATGMEITGYASSYTYTGNAITPDVVVTMNGRTLNRGTDYTVTYSNNTNVGTATMTVAGIGSFSGTKTINYVIEAKNIENCITTAVNNYQYTGNTYTPSVTLTDSSTGKTLAAGTDYTITYSNNTNPGTASITVTALSRNYTGSKVISFKITSAAVSGLRVSQIRNNSMKLSWSDQDYADGYQICNADSRVIGTTSNNSYTVKRLTSCTTYRYKVRSYVENADGSVSYGNFSTVVAAQTMLNTPTLKARSTSRGNVTLTWSKVAKASGYEIYYSTEKNGIYTKLKTVSRSSARRYVDSGLASGEKYYYTIRAYRTVNGVKTYSSYNTIKSATVK